MKLIKSQKGQGMIEYAVILAIVVAIAAVAITNKDTIVNAVQTVFDDAVTKLQGLNTTGNTTP